MSSATHVLICILSRLSHANHKAIYMVKILQVWQKYWKPA